MRRAGFVLARRRDVLPAQSFWAWQAIEGGFAARVETDASDQDWADALRELAPREASAMSLTDTSQGVFRACYLSNERLDAALFLAPATGRQGWTVLREAFAAKRLDPAARRLLLSGISSSGFDDEGPNVCACFGVARGLIEASIEAGCNDVASIGKRLKAGTNCGSCIPELKKMLALRQPVTA
jgi:assimilatory nitrate reductase catalytic subunit